MERTYFTTIIIFQIFMIAEDLLENFDIFGCRRHFSMDSLGILSRCPLVHSLVEAGGSIAAIRSKTKITSAKNCTKNSVFHHEIFYSVQHNFSFQPRSANNFMILISKFSFFELKVNRTTRATNKKKVIILPNAEKIQKNIHYTGHELIAFDEITR